MQYNHWKIIWIATAFNVLFEYSLRGFNNLAAQPALPVVLVITYFTLFAMVEDLITRFKLKPYQLMILSFFYGTIYLAYVSGIVFLNPTFAGIAWGGLFYVNIVWWGALQAVLTFYLANKIAPREWNHPPLSVMGWILCLVGNLFMIFLFQKSGAIPFGTPQGKGTIFIILLISLVAFLVTLKNKRTIAEVAFKNSRFMNIASVVTTVIFFFSALFLTHDPIRSGTSNVNATSLRLISIYTLGLAIALLGYRFFKKKKITV